MTTFNNNTLNPNIIQAIEELGFKTPTDIQEKVIPAILETDNDLIALAQTGTGKTAGFGLPLIQQITDYSAKNQALILCPTRELCLQINNDLIAYTKYTKKLKTIAVYGGASIVPQLADLKKGVHIVVGTPGRTLDLIKRKALNVKNIKFLVLDEADEMLQMGFKDELDAILESTPKEKRTLLFSATMPQEVRKIASNYMNNAIELQAEKTNTKNALIKHHYYLVNRSNKYLTLKRIADINPDIYGIIFCRTRRETKEIADKLMQDGYNADALHGDLSQSQRDFVMQRFRQRHLQILVATDVAARGLDVNNLTHVINYNLPDESEIYVHRSGRTGRAGNEGISIAIVSQTEAQKLKRIEKLISAKFERKQVPNGEEICKKRLFNLIDKVENVTIDEEQINSFLPEVTKKLSWLTRDELIKRFVSVEFNRFLEYYKDSQDLNISADKKGTKSKDKKIKGKGKVNGFARFYINIGSKHKVNASTLIGMINQYSKNKDIEIGKIDILRNFSFFEVDKNYKELIKESFVNKKQNNVALLVEEASIPKPQDKRVNQNKSKRKNKRKR